MNRNTLQPPFVFKSLHPGIGLEDNTESTKNHSRTATRTKTTFKPAATSSSPKVEEGNRIIPKLLRTRGREQSGAPTYKNQNTRASSFGERTASLWRDIFWSSGQINRTQLTWNITKWLIDGVIVAGFLLGSLISASKLLRTLYHDESPLSDFAALPEIMNQNYLSWPILGIFLFSYAVYQILFKIISLPSPGKYFSQKWGNIH